MSDQDWDEDEDEPPTEERAASLEALQAQARERLGEQEWRRLSWRLLIGRIAYAGGLLAFFLAACAAFTTGLGVIGLLVLHLVSGTRPPVGFFTHRLLFLAIALGAGFLLAILDYVIEIPVRRALEECAAQGEDDEQLWQAFRARFEVPWIRRRLAEQAREAAAEERLPQEMGTAPSRWQLESSGAYLVWWLCAAFWLSWLIFRWPLPERLLESIGVITVTGLLFRLILLAVIRGPRQRPSDRLGTIRFSWWWGRGWLPAFIALLPGVAYWEAMRWSGGR